MFSLLAHFCNRRPIWPLMNTLIYLNHCCLLWSVSQQITFPSEQAHDLLWRMKISLFLGVPLSRP